MHILYIDNDKRSRDVGARCLSEQGDEVEIATELSGARQILARRVPSVILIDSQTAGASLISFIQWVRTLQAKTRPYIILLTSVASFFPLDLIQSLEHGADDFLRKPLLKEELIFRAHTLKRLSAFASQLGQMSKVQDLTTNDDLTSLGCWQGLTEVLAQDFAGMLGITLKPRQVQNPLFLAHMAAQIPMTLTQNQARVQIAVGLDTASAAFLANELFQMPDAPPEMLQDIVREFANTAGGAFKRAAENDKLLLTTGLPENISPRDFSTENPLASTQVLYANDDETIRVMVEAEIRSKGLQHVKVSDLHEGMVLSKDLLNSAGMLLVRSGTRLTSSNVERIARIVPPHQLVEVAA